MADPTTSGPDDDAVPDGDGRRGDARGDVVRRADDELALALTAVLRGAPGVVDVFDARPRRDVAVAAVEQGVGHGLRALGVDAPSSGAGPRGLVHVERRADGHGSAEAHVATDVTASTPRVLAEAAARLRQHLADVGERPDAWTLRVVARLVDGA